MAIKTLTVSALTGGALLLAYAAWSKLRATPRQIAAVKPPQVESVQPLALPVEPLAVEARSSHIQPEPASLAQAGAGESIDVLLDDLWSSEENAPNSNEQLVDFSAELEDDDELDGSVAPEGLGVRWLTRATEAMSPFHHALSVREEAEVALLDGASRETIEPPPESTQRSADSVFDLEFPVEKQG